MENNNEHITIDEGPAPSSAPGSAVSPSPTDGDGKPTKADRVEALLAGPIDSSSRSARIDGPANDKGGGRIEGPAFADPVTVCSKLGQSPYAKHVALLASGVAPADIPHIVLGYGRGCLCPQCHAKRLAEISGGPGPVASVGGLKPLLRPGVSGLLAGKIWGRILALPDKGMEVWCRSRSYPKAVVKVWDTDKETLQIFEEYGKFFSEKYFNLPNFKHKELVEFGIFYAGRIATNVATMNLILKDEAENAGTNS